MSYLKWQQQIVSDFSDENLNTIYDNGFLFGRIDRGVADQTRSIRVDLYDFELSSENRRIMKKTEGLEISGKKLPYSNYDWSIGKLGKDFYDTKFGEKTFSANKIKELLTDPKKSNFNTLCIFKFRPATTTLPENSVVGYCISLITDQIMHYCYPFYRLDSEISNLGLGMMLRAILWAKETNKRYIYLGSAQRPSDTYKLQFSGLEWFDGKEWQSGLDELKKILVK